MHLFQPAARAYRAERHPAFDAHVGGRRSSPGAGRDKRHMYYYNEGANYDHAGPAVSAPSVVANLQLSSEEDTPTISLGSPTSVTTLFSSSVLSPSSNIILSSSSSSPSPTSTPTPTTTAVTSSTALQSPVSTVPVGGAVTSPVPADSALAGAAKGSSARMSGGVIAAVVVVLLLAMGAVAFFVFRRYGIQKRVARRVTWTAKLSPRPFDVPLEKGVDHDHPAAVSSDTQIETANRSSKEEGGNGQEKVVPAVRNIARKPPLPYSPVSPIAPSSPSQSQISIPDAAAGAGARAPSLDSANASTVPSTPLPEMIPALVRMTFVPQLPDELAITPGETLYIRSEFDDGWALCANNRGKQGMVPLECLEGGGGQFAGRSQLRTTRRASSLTSPKW